MNEASELLIRISTSITMIVYGLHQMVRPAAWLSYMPVWLQKLLPMKSTTFMKEHGLGNVALGALFLLNIKPEIIYWAVLIWWLSILPFAFYEDWRNGMRDVIIIAGIVALVINAGLS